MRLEFGGEWIRHLYGEKGEQGILSFDIELGQAYNEQVRGAGYTAATVGNESLEFFKDKSGFFVPDSLRKKNADDFKAQIYHTTSFYDFLKNFYAMRSKIDAERISKNE